MVDLPIWLFIGVPIALVLVVGAAVLFGPPYVPTLTLPLKTALDLLDLKPGETLLDLGSGDGRVLLAAARRGWNAVGIEVSPLLVLVARIRTWRYRKQVRIIWGNYFLTRWPEADGIFAFMIQYQMKRLDERIEKWHKKPVRLASFAFEIPGKTPVGKRDAVSLYEYK
ncbi:MAG TPA: class I SAM-dependent methyltransferase [Candidatus Saccharimonadales bacterium]|nr:class I SAM-dependent methyltransferase [Candidatus Saccharimonadales bacterium]